MPRNIDNIENRRVPELEGKSRVVLLMDGPDKGRRIRMDIESDTQNIRVLTASDGWHEYVLRGVVRDASGDIGARHIGKCIDTEEDQFLNLDSMLDPTHVDDRLPIDGQWVLAHYLGDNWGCEDKGQYWVVAKFIRGMSKAERKASPDYDSRNCISMEDEHGDNLRPFYWTQFGPGQLFGQDVDYWMELPIISSK